MKKTVSVNIKGMNFLIEEDAYELLQSYMDRLKHSLRNEKGSKEIIEDIEFRVAELCSGHLNDKKQVIEKEDIKQIIKTLGEPEEYVEASEEFQQEEKTFTHKQNFKKEEKRLYRDLENAKIAGVCGGLANYLQIDVVIVRAIFLIFFFFFGFGFPLYIVLWLVIPKAISTIERLRMQGKPITVESVREEVETAASRFKDESNSLAHKLRKDGEIGQRLNKIGRFISSAIGIVCFGFGLTISSFLVMLLIGLEIIPFLDGEGLLSVSEFGELILSNSTDVFWTWVATLTIGFSAILFLFILGAKLIFSLKNKWINVSLVSLISTGVLGIFIAIFVGIKTGQDTIHEGNIYTEIGTTNCQELIIKSQFKKIQNSNDYEVPNDEPIGFFSIEGNQIVESGIHFEYKISTDSSFHVYKKLHSRSSRRSKARGKARHIKHNVSIFNNTLLVDTEYSFPKRDKFRDQNVYIIIEIPNGKTVLIGNQKIALRPDHFQGNTIDLQYTEAGYLYGDGEYQHDVDLDFEVNL